MRAIEYLLTLADWQWFCTFTWSDENMGSIRKREQNLDRFLRQRWNDSGNGILERGSLTGAPTVIRWERGEQNERPHCHVLLDGFPPHKVHKAEGHRWAALWYRHYGLARVRPYDASQRGAIAAYLTPPDLEHLPPTNRHEANRYERSKFDLADRLCINSAAWARWQRLTGTAFDVLHST